MERRLITEEFVTRSVMKLLKDCGWDIISFDLPEMGTGTVLHKNGTSGKNKECIIPDVFAYKNGGLLFCESKDFFSEDDVDKMMDLKNGLYNDSISKRLRKLKWKNTWVSIAYPKLKSTGKEDYKDVDFTFLVELVDIHINCLNTDYNNKLFN